MKEKIRLSRFTRFKKICGWITKQKSLSFLDSISLGFHKVCSLAVSLQKQQRALLVAESPILVLTLRLEYQLRLCIKHLPLPKLNTDSVTNKSKKKAANLGTVM